MKAIKLLPAHAGVILKTTFRAGWSETSPRTRGGDPVARFQVQHVRDFSPHTRG